MKKTAIALIMALTINLFSFSASAVDYNESESNNTFSTADITYDDYSNYGTLSSSSDTDYWKITFSQGGIANFYLSPGTGNDFDLYLYDNEQKLKAYSTRRPAGKYELIRARVYSGRTYYMRVVYVNGVSSQNYQLRAKCYNLKPASLFTFEYNNYNTRIMGEYIQQNLWGSGYVANHYLNNPVTPAFNVLPNSSIYYFNHHGSPGYLCFYNNTYLYGNYSPTSTTNQALSSLSTTALSDVNLMLFISCKVGLPSSYGNFVDIALSKGARNCISWKETIKTLDGNNWSKFFFDKLATGVNILEAINYADAMMESVAVSYLTILSYYGGNSRPAAFALG